jgi:hypothetical protein
MSGVPRRSFRRLAQHLVLLGLSLAWMEPGIGIADTPTIPAPLAAETPRTDRHRRLTGIVISPELRVAVFALAGETRTVREGEKIDGWVVTAIRPEGVTVEAEGETKLLVPEALAPAGAEAPPALPAAAQAQKARSVSEALLKQKQDQAAAESALLEATAKMKGH